LNIEKSHPIWYTNITPEIFSKYINKDNIILHNYIAKQSVKENIIIEIYLYIDVLNKTKKL